MPAAVVRDGIKIDLSQVPKVDMDNLCRDLLAAMERFYSDPENVRKFEEWLKEKETTDSEKLQEKS